MHGVVALKFGDRTAENAGRLTLNPLPHIDPIGTVLVPLVLIISNAPVIGWAKPVPVNPLNFNDIKRGELLVSLAGIASNFSLALIAASVFHLNQAVFQIPLVRETMGFAVYINLLLGVFNLFPIPPLDGSKAVSSLLSYNMAKEYQKLEFIGPFILIALLFTGVLGSVLGLIIRPLTTILLTGNLMPF